MVERGAFLHGGRHTTQKVLHMNLTTPLAQDDIAVLRTRQLEATKRRVIAELRTCAIARATVQYSADVHGSGDVIIKATTAEGADDTVLTMQHGIDGAFYDLATLIERFALDLVAHHHSGFEEDGGFGYVILTTATGSARVEHTSIEPNEVMSDITF